MLVEALEKQGGVVFNIEKIYRFDLMGLQLLCAAHRTALTLDKAITFMGTGQSAFIKASHEAGLVRHSGCLASPENGNCLWVPAANE